jgi:putative hydrolase of the HAD superfamily
MTIQQPMEKMHTISHPVRAVLLDLDNTLVHRSQSIARYANRFVHDFADSLTSVSPHTVARLVNRQDNGGYLPSDSPFPTVRAAVVHSLVLDLPWRRTVQQEEIASHWASRFPECTVEMKGASELCDQLVALGVRIGIVSNGAEKSRLATVERLSFHHRISSILSSERAGVRKPDAAIFATAARELGVVNEECVFVGDHPINDVAGALSAGMGAIWLEGFHPWQGDISSKASSVTSLLQVLDHVAETGGRAIT